MISYYMGSRYYVSDHYHISNRHYVVYIHFEYSFIWNFVSIVNKHYSYQL